MYIHLKNIEPLALNNSHKITTRGKFASKFKTKECKQYESEIENQLRKYKSEFNKLNKSFDEIKNCFRVDYRFYYPIKTKKGVISKKSKDIDNCIKILQDQIFKNVIADDSFITELSASKIHSLNSYIEINIKILSYN